MKSYTLLEVKNLKALLVSISVLMSAVLISWVVLDHVDTRPKTQFVSSELAITLSIDKNSFNNVTVLRDRVMEIVRDYLCFSEIDVAYGLYIVDGDFEIRGMVDIFVLPYEIVPFTFANMMHSNQAMMVSHNSPGQIERTRARMSALTDPNSDLYVSFFDNFKPAVSTVAIQGEFVFLNQLVQYWTDGGLVIYQVLENRAGNFRGSTNVFNYDTNRFIVFHRPDFDLDLFSGSRLIPGMNQERFEEIQIELWGQQARAQVAFEAIEQFNDPSILAQDVTHDWWMDIEIPEGQSLIFGPDGNLTFGDNPPTGSLWGRFLIGVGVIALTAIVAVVTVATAGGAAIVAKIAVAAAKGAVVGAASGAAVGYVLGGAISIGADLLAGRPVDWARAANAANEGFMSGFANGAIFGAAFGGLGGALQYYRQMANPALNQLNQYAARTARMTGGPAGGTAGGTSARLRAARPRTPPRAPSTGGQTNLTRNVVGQSQDQILLGGRGFQSHSGLTTHMRATQQIPHNHQIHHIVGQNPNNLARFGRHNIHNTNNAVNIPRTPHVTINAAHNTHVGGQALHRTISNLSFETQFRLGQQITSQALRNYAAGMQGQQATDALVRFILTLL